VAQKLQENISEENTSNTKGKTNLNFTEERDSKWQWHQLGHMQVCNQQRQSTEGR